MSRPRDFPISATMASPSRTPAMALSSSAENAFSSSSSEKASLLGVVASLGSLSLGAASGASFSALAAGFSFLPLFTEA
jgi:hypothetical protein